jgi:hypothetical protein
MSPYLTILAINAASWASPMARSIPRLDPLTARRMMRADLFVTAVALAAAAWLFAGRGLDFAIGPVALRWWGFSLLSML